MVVQHIYDALYIDTAWRKIAKNCKQNPSAHFKHTPHTLSQSHTTLQLCMEKVMKIKINNSFRSSESKTNRPHTANTKHPFSL